MYFFFFSDLERLYNSEELDPEYSPKSLQNKVMFDIRLYFCRRGSENFKDMTKTTFKTDYDEQSKLWYVRKQRDENDKNHDENDSEIVTGYMPQIKFSKFCPVTSFDNYLSRLSDSDSLWQRPLPSASLSKNMTCYSREVIGKNPLSTFMSDLSKKCGLSRIYTNHSIRVTGCTILARNKCSNKQIMSVSGHKSLQSLAIYQRVSDSEKINMGTIISQTLTDPHALALLPPNQHSAIQSAPHIAPSATCTSIQDQGVEDNSDRLALLPPNQPLAIESAEATCSMVPSAACMVPSISGTCTSIQDQSAARNNTKTLAVLPPNQPSVIEPGPLAIPDYLDFDLAELLNDDFSIETETVTDTQSQKSANSNTMISVQKQRVVSTTSTSQRSPNLHIPSFSGCKIGNITINIQK